MELKWIHKIAPISLMKRQVKKHGAVVNYQKINLTVMDLIKEQNLSLSLLILKKQKKWLDVDVKKRIMPHFVMEATVNYSSIIFIL